MPTQHRLRLLCGNAFDALFVVDDRGRYLHVNAAAADLLGVPRDELVRRCVADFSPPELRPELRRLNRELHRRGTLSDGPYPIVRADGSRRLVEFRAARDFGPGEHLVVIREVVARPHTNGSRLTERERQVLQLAADGGGSTSEIARQLVVSAGTVKTHFENAYGKLGVTDRAAAVAEGMRRGLID